MTHGVGFWCYRVVLAGGLKEGFVCSQPKVEDQRSSPLSDMDVAAGVDAPKTLEGAAAEGKWPASSLASPTPVSLTALGSSAASSTTSH